MNININIHFYTLLHHSDLEFWLVDYIPDSSAAADPRCLWMRYRFYSNNVLLIYKRTCIELLQFTLATVSQSEQWITVRGSHLYFQPRFVQFQPAKVKVKVTCRVSTRRAFSCVWEFLGMVNEWYMTDEINILLLGWR